MISENNVGYSIFDLFFYVVMLLIIFLMFKILRYFSKDNRFYVTTFKTHDWKNVQLLNQAHYCSFCESLLIDGFICETCGVCTEERCFKKVNAKFKCKEVSTSAGPMKHHWVKGNLPLGSCCYVCDEECCAEPGLLDHRCIWCQRCVHSACKILLGEVCDFGKNKVYILPPNYVAASYKRPRIRSTLVVESVSDPGWKEWTPIFILGNSKSGNNKGEEVVCSWRGAVNPCQVVDLSSTSPRALIHTLTLLPESADPLLLVAGGDGSVAWLLSDLAAYFSSQKVPPVGIIPLGTGNDLSRVLGWGSQEPSDISPAKIFSLLKIAKTVPLDRWSVKISSARQLRFSRPPKSLFMYNYLSIGVDALVTLKFHNTRQSRFYIFSSRIINKMMYLAFGTEQVLERCCKDLNEQVELYMDGKRVELPALESIVILNIASWGAGVSLWNAGTNGESDGLVPEQKMDDGKLEVAALYSSLHIAQLQVGLSQPHRLGQASNITVVLKSKMPVQVDGEPWMQPPGQISVSLHNKASVLMLT